MGNPILPKANARRTVQRTQSPPLTSTAISFPSTMLHLSLDPNTVALREEASPLLPHLVRQNTKQRRVH